MKKKYEFRSNLTTCIKAFMALFIVIIIISIIVLTIWDISYNHDEYL